MVKVKLLGMPMYLKLLQAPRFKKGFTLSKPVPWDRDYGAGEQGASAAQLEVWARFAEVAHRTRGLPLRERLATIARELSVGVGGVASKVYGVSKEEYIRRKIEARRIPPERVAERIREWRSLAAAKAGKVTATY
jgi:hypothetical protein